MGPRLLLSHTIAPIKNRSVCADFWSEKKSVRFFLGAACDKKSVVCADLVREKIGPPLRLFLGAPYDKKSVLVRWALETGWEKLSKRREHHRLIILYKILNDLAPEHLRNIFLSYTNLNSGYNLRHNNMQLILSRTETFRSSFFPASFRLRARSLSKKHGFFVFI